MKLAMIGFGQAGGKIVDKFLEHDQRTGSQVVRSAVAVNTAKADLLGLEQIPQENRVLIGQARVKGHGVGADNELGAEIAEEDIDEIQGAIDSIPVHEVDAFLIVAGLGVLPGSDEGGIYTLNAARSFQTFVREVDNLLVFDNDAWRKTGESVEGGYDEINEEIVRRFGVLFGAGEVEAGDNVAESVVDSSEIINTLGGGGVSTVGYATESVELSNSGGLLSRFKSDGQDDGIESANTTNRVTSLVRKAALGRLTLPCEIEGAERALLVLSGPPKYLNRKGIERGRKWLEEQTGSMEVRGGDYPQNEPSVAAAVLLSGVHNVPRIKELQQVAIEAQDNIDEIRQESEGNLETLVEDEEDELDPLF